MSINSVLISLRFDTSPKTKFAAGSVKRPCRGVPIMIGRKTGPANSCSGILRFVAGTGGSLQEQFARRGQQSGVHGHRDLPGGYAAWRARFARKLKPRRLDIARRLRKQFRSRPDGLCLSQRDVDDLGWRVYAQRKPVADPVGDNELARSASIQTGPVTKHRRAETELLA
jgi:hypothetical protein